MKDARTNRRTDSNRQLRARRGVEAVVAQYIRERSGRTTQSRPRGGAGRPAGDGAALMAQAR